MDDLISRQAAIDAIDKALSRTFVEPCGEMILKDLPSAQPEREKGKWVGCDDDWLKTMCKCSECGAMIDINEKYRNFFCYHCGARMDGELV